MVTQKTPPKDAFYFLCVAYTLASIHLCASDDYNKRHLNNIRIPATTFLIFLTICLFGNCTSQRKQSNARKYPKCQKCLVILPWCIHNQTRCEYSCIPLFILRVLQKEYAMQCNSPYCHHHWAFALCPCFSQSRWVQYCFPSNVNR